MAKLIDLLVQELPKRGGWPEGAAGAVQDYDGQVCFFQQGDKPKFNESSRHWPSYELTMEWVFFSSYFTLASDYATTIATREQYEAALSASQQPAWNGEGLPPVGLQIEYTCQKFSEHNRAILEGYWYSGTIIAYYEDFVWTSDNGIRPLHNTKFRPVRTEAERKRESICDAIYGALTKAEREHNRSDEADAVYDAIAAGKIPGVKLENEND